MAKFNEYPGYPEQPNGHTLRLRAHSTGFLYSEYDLYGGINLHICCETCDEDDCFWFSFSGPNVQGDLVDHILLWHPNFGQIEFSCDLSQHAPGYFSDIFQFINHLRVYRGEVDDGF